MDALVDFLLNFHGPTPYFIVFGILLLCGFGLPIPEDITLIAGGLLAYYGLCDLVPMILVGFFGVMIGDSCMYLLGARYGRKLTRRWIFQKLLPEDRLRAASEKFQGPRGNQVLFFARFMPGLRAPMFFSAGLLHVPFTKFLFWDGLAAVLSVPAIVGAVYYFGDQLDQVVRIITRVEHGILLAIVLGALAIGLKWWISHRKLKDRKLS